jgi:hypothetical protein
MVNLHALAVLVEHARVELRVDVPALRRSQPPPERQLWGLVQTLLALAAGAYTRPLFGSTFRLN